MEKLAILIVDIDDDLGKKAKIYGPVIGEEGNLEAAQKLALADPQDSDSNTIFKGINLYREIVKTNPNVILATITGHEDLGYKAGQKISEQLEILINMGVNKVILVTDGVMDEEIMPILKSKDIAIESIERVYIRQSKELEKIYYVILDKANDPKFKKWIYLMPGILSILLGALLLGVDISSILAILFLFFGIISITKAFSIDNLINFSYSEKVESKMSFSTLFLVYYSIAFTISVFYIYPQNLIYGSLIAMARALEILDLLMLFYIVVTGAIKLIQSKNIVDFYSNSQIFILIVYVFVSILLWTNWITETFLYLSFKDTLISFIILSIATLSILYYINQSKIIYFYTLDLVGKNVYSKNGVFYGIIENLKRKKLIIRTIHGNKTSIDVEKVEELDDDRIIVDF
jgi:uncharacterized membrane protein